MKDIAKKYFIEQGYSCSEAVLKAAIDKGFAPKEILMCATSFSGGMGSGCLCGAVAGAQLVLGTVFGRMESSQDASLCRQKAKALVEEFRTRHKFTCCKALTAGFDMGTKDRKLHCSSMVESACDILENLLKEQKLPV